MQAIFSSRSAILTLTNRRFPDIKTDCQHSNYGMEA